ncbi:MAG: LysR family transcriptional regulator [Pseudomonadota bacterium]
MSKFRQYEIFAAAAERGSLSEAARVLDVSVAAVSKQIRSLEADTGTKLLDRTASGVRLTPLGQRFYVQCREILTSVENAEDGLRSAQASMDGRISITLSRALAVRGVYGALAEFSEAHAGIRFDLIFDETLQNLKEANIDFALRIGRVDDHADIVAVPLMRVRPVLCATPAYMERLGSKPGGLSSANSVATVPVNLSTAVRTRLRKWGIDFSGPNVHTVTDLDGARGAICAGLCMGVLLDIAIKEELINGQLVEVRPGEHLPGKQLYLLYARDRLMLRRQREFKNFLRDRLKAAGRN